MRIGLIGYGGFGRFLHQAYDALPGCRVTAVADPSIPDAGQGVLVVPTLEALLALDAVDLVVDASPPHLHARHTHLAFAHGMPIVVEKPVAISPDEVQALRAAHTAHPVPATVDFMMRFNPLIAWIQTHARAGTWGALRRYTVENYAQDETLPPDHWFWDERQSGGILVEHAVHFIDVLHGCTDARPVSVEGQSVRRDSGQRDRMAFTAVYEDGVVMSQYHSFSRPNFFEETRFRFVFDLAEIDLLGWMPLSGTIRVLGTEATCAVLDALPQWQETALSVLPKNEYRSGGIAYAATHQRSGTFALPQDKATVYRNAVQALLLDFLQHLHTPTHPLRVTYEDGLRAVEVAVAATRVFGQSD